METLAQRGETFQYCVVGEPSSAATLGDTVRIGRRGSLSGIMTIRGVQGHVAYPLQADNPIHALAKFVAAMTREPIDAGNEHFPPTTFQMVNVHSDAGAPNVVPGELKCRFNLRYSNVWTHEQLVGARRDSCSTELGIDYEIRWRVAGKPFLTQPGRLTAAVQAAVREATGLDARAVDERRHVGRALHRAVRHRRRRARPDQRDDPQGQRGRVDRATSSASSASTSASPSCSLVDE